MQLRARERLHAEASDSVVNSGASHFSLDPAHLGWLRTSLELFNKAMALYLNDAERTFACLPSNQGKNNPSLG
eukprot:1160859-Pelagomonas_calceolata.AAC.4